MKNSKHNTFTQNDHQLSINENTNSFAADENNREFFTLTNAFENTNAKHNSINDSKMTKGKSKVSNHRHNLSVTEISLSNCNLRSENILTRVANMLNLKALDLSYNKIDCLPRGLPSSLIAINLSYNRINNVLDFSTHCKLIELHLSNNQIVSTAGLGSITTLEYIDLSGNLIKMITSFESLLNLKTLILDDNEISSHIGLRLLSVNKNLIYLGIANNPIAKNKGFSTVITNMIPSLQKINGKAIRQSVHMTAVPKLNSYFGIFEDKSSFSNKKNSPIIKTIPPRPKTSSYDKAERHNISLDASKYRDIYSVYDSNDIDVNSIDSSKTARNSKVLSSLPWRRKPDLLPRAKKDNSLQSKYIRRLHDSFNLSAPPVQIYDDINSWEFKKEKVPKIEGDEEVLDKLGKISLSTSKRANCRTNDSINSKNHHSSNTTRSSELRESFNTSRIKYFRENEFNEKRIQFARKPKISRHSEILAYGDNHRPIPVFSKTISKNGSKLNDKNSDRGESIDVDSPLTSTSSSPSNENNERLQFEVNRITPKLVSSKVVVDKINPFESINEMYTTEDTNSEGKSHTVTTTPTPFDDFENKSHPEQLSIALNLLISRKRETLKLLQDANVKIAS